MMLVLVTSGVLSAAPDPYPPQLVIGSCTLSSAKGWKLTARGQVQQGSQCASCQNPPGNGGFAYMAPCGGSAAWQTWDFNRTRWAASAPNVSGAIMLPAEPGSSADYGFTYDKNADRSNMKPGGFLPNRTVPIQIFDIGPNGRFPGECRGNSNCNFDLDETTGSLKTYHGLCLAVSPTHAPAPPPPAPPTPPPFAKTACNGTLCFSWTQGSHMVLQSAPAKAAVYGTFKSTAADSAADATISVTITPVDGGGDPYTVPATVKNEGWKALLKPSPPGGNFTISAKCSAGCAGGGEAELVDVT